VRRKIERILTFDAIRDCLERHDPSTAAPRPADPPSTEGLESESAYIEVVSKSGRFRTAKHGASPESARAVCSISISSPLLLRHGGEMIDNA